LGEGGGGEEGEQERGGERAGGHAIVIWVAGRGVYCGAGQVEGGDVG
jgi:hypothetical protein